MRSYHRSYDNSNRSMMVQSRIPAKIKQEIDFGRYSRLYHHTSVTIVVASMVTSHFSTLKKKISITRTICSHSKSNNFGNKIPKITPKKSEV